MIMSTVGSAEAKAHLSALLDAVEADEEVVITRRGQALARLIPDRGTNRPTDPSAVELLREEP